MEISWRAPTSSGPLGPPPRASLTRRSPLTHRSHRGAACSGHPASERGIPPTFLMPHGRVHLATRRHLHAADRAGGAGHLARILAHSARDLRYCLRESSIVGNTISRKGPLNRSALASFIGDRPTCGMLLIAMVTLATASARRRRSRGRHSAVSRSTATCSAVGQRLVRGRSRNRRARAATAQAFPACRPSRP